MTPTHSLQELFCNLSTGTLRTNSQPKMMRYDPMTMEQLTGHLAWLKWSEGATMVKIEVLAAKTAGFENQAHSIELLKLQIGASV